MAECLAIDFGEPWLLVNDVNLSEGEWEFLFKEYEPSSMRKWAYFIGDKRDCFCHKSMIKYLFIDISD